MKRTRGGTSTGAFPPPLSDIEVARMWRALANTPPPVPRRRRARPPLLLGVGVALAGAAATFAGVLFFSSPNELESMGSDPAAVAELRELELPDGSRVALGPGARLRPVNIVHDDVELALLAGSLELAVAEVPAAARRFVVTAGAHDLSTYGARFRVALTGDAHERRLEVAVHAGEVEIQDPVGGGLLRLGAGRTWSSLLGAGQALPTAALHPPDSP